MGGVLLEPSFENNIDNKKKKEKLIILYISLLKKGDCFFRVR
jgi:hypothetical protein